MSLDTISQRLSTLRDTIKSVSQLVQRLAKLQPSSTSSDELSGEEARADLAAEIQESLRQAEDEHELLKQDVEDMTSPGVESMTSSFRRSGTHQPDNSETALVRSESERTGEKLKMLRARFRRAQLQARRTFDAAARAERAMYLSQLRTMDLGGSPDDSNADDANTGPRETPETQRNTLFAGRRRAGGASGAGLSTQDDMVVTASADITASLRRTHAVLTAELSRSRFAQETLDESNAALRELNERYGSLGDILTQSRGLLGTLVNSQKSDTWYLETAMWVLIVTIAVELARRLLFGPLWWVAFFPLKLLWAVLSVVLRVAGITGSRASEPVLAPVSSVLAFSASTLVASASSAVSTPAAVSEHIVDHHDADASASASPEGSLSESIGEMEERQRHSGGGTFVAMAEAAQFTEPAQEDTQRNEQQGESHGEAQAEHQDEGQGERQGQAGEEGQRRGDRQVLQERDEATQPRNPKKRMWEEPPRGANSARDEL